MRVVVMGTGGVGRYFGAKPAASGADVTFVARGAHGEAIRREGLFVKSPLGDLRIHPARCVANPAAAAPADAALFCIKLTDTEEAARALSPVVKAGFDAIDASGRASMAFDIEHVKPLESPYLSGAIVRMGKALGVPTPTHQFFSDALAVWEKGAKAKAS